MTWAGWDGGGVTWDGDTGWPGGMGGTWAGWDGGDTGWVGWGVTRAIHVPPSCRSSTYA